MGALIVVGVLSIALSFSLYRGYKTNRKLNQAITTIQETQEKLIRQEQLSYEEKLATQRAEQEMKLLRAQMNPHFIFNALNSIHNCILQKDTMTASSSLTKFSRLVRRILESSRQAIVSLETELSTLELYIQLEQMRFNTKFDYKISIEPGIDMNEFSVPPLILQPFVENSIWHGLMPSSKKGIIEIEVKKRGDLLHFSIIDNGIGRQKSADLKRKASISIPRMDWRLQKND
ncbi:MAG: histidine kinase [Bacteroidetes bacterium]|nr:histidine kinase [Bacteroidota bacterium]